MTLEDDFHIECIRAVDECRRMKYVPTAWIGMMNGPGGAVVAAQVPTSGLRLGVEIAQPWGARTTVGTVEAAVSGMRARSCPGEGWARGACRCVIPRVRSIRLGRWSTGPR